MAITDRENKQIAWVAEHIMDDGWALTEMTMNGVRVVCLCQYDPPTSDGFISHRRLMILNNPEIDKMLKEDE
jgi:hypothetical protein